MEAGKMTFLTRLKELAQESESLTWSHYYNHRFITTSNSDASPKTILALIQSCEEMEEALEHIIKQAPYSGADLDAKEALESHRRRFSE